MHRLEVSEAGEGERDLVSPTAEVFRVVTLSEERADIRSPWHHRGSLDWS